MYKNIQFFDFNRLHFHNTRNRNDLLPPFERLNTTQQSVMYNGSRIWNELPDTMKTSPSISIFKYRLKQSLLSKYDSSDQ